MACYVVSDEKRCSFLSNRNCSDHLNLAKETQINYFGVDIYLNNNYFIQLFYSNVL